MQLEGNGVKNVTWTDKSAQLWNHRYQPDKELRVPKLRRRPGSLAGRVRGGNRKTALHRQYLCGMGNMRGQAHTHCGAAWEAQSLARKTLRNLACNNKNCHRLYAAELNRKASMASQVCMRHQVGSCRCGHGPTEHNPTGILSQGTSVA